MKMELKTLKDIDTLLIEKGMDNVPSKVIEAYNKRLKQEAIKDIKFYDNSNVINYIKWKFNLTEEDLKCKQNKKKK